MCGLRYTKSRLNEGGSCKYRESVDNANPISSSFVELLYILMSTRQNLKAWDFKMCGRRGQRRNSKTATRNRPGTFQGRNRSYGCHKGSNK